MDFSTLPQWMQDAWPWMVWVGGVAGAAAILVSLFFEVLKRWKRFIDGNKSAIDD